VGSYHADSHPITLVHDSLKDKPSVITPDVFFFPQLVVIKHLSSCNSKATLSKRHKSKRVKEGGSWCHNPTGCKPKNKCSCQAYPSRHVSVSPFPFFVTQKYQIFPFLISDQKRVAFTIGPNEETQLPRFSPDLWQTIVQNGIHPISKTGASNARLQLVPGCTCRSLGNVHAAETLLRTAQHPHGGRPPVRRYMEGFSSQGQHHLPMIACPCPSFLLLWISSLYLSIYLYITQCVRLF